MTILKIKKLWVKSQQETLSSSRTSFHYFPLMKKEQLQCLPEHLCRFCSVINSWKYDCGSQKPRQEKYTYVINKFQELSWTDLYYLCFLFIISHNVLKSARMTQSQGCKYFHIKTSHPLFNTATSGFESNAI